jgi:hypothetical protein
MATLAVTQLLATGAVEPALTAAAGGGDQFPNNGRTYLKVTNGGGAPITVTIASQRSCDQGSTHNTTNSITNGTTELMGPFPTERFNDALGMVQVTYSAVTTVTVGAFSV